MGMSENAGVDPRVAAAEKSAYGEEDVPDQTQVAEDPARGERREAEPHDPRGRSYS